MSTTFYIAPYQISDWDNVITEYLRLEDKLIINPEHYKNGLINRWSDTKILKSDLTENIQHPLRWILPPSRLNFSGLNGELHSNLHLVSFGTGPKESFLDYIMWHRQYIPEHYSLYLFNSVSPDVLELTFTTSSRIIENFTGIID